MPTEKNLPGLTVGVDGVPDRELSGVHWQTPGGPCGPTAPSAPGRPRSPGTPGGPLNEVTFTGGAGSPFGPATPEMPGSPVKEVKSFCLPSFDYTCDVTLLG